MASVTAQVGEAEPGSSLAAGSTAAIQQDIDKLDQKLAEANKFSVAAVKDSELFKISTATIKCDRLAENQLFKNLIGRLEAFYVLAEKFRLVGPTEQQQETLKRTGFSFSYHIELHKSLKKLIIKVINQRDPILQGVYLKEAYTWFFNKLCKMGMLSKVDIERDLKLLNPTARSMAASMTKMIKHKVLQSLVDENETAEYYKQMFEDSTWIPSERTIHPAIPPANVRIKNFQSKEISGYEKQIKEIEQRKEESFNQKQIRMSEDNKKGLYFANMGSIYDQPQTSRADQRTLANTSLAGSSVTNFEKTERAIKPQPFSTFYTVNMSTDKPQEVKFVSQNRFEGRSNYFNYYPTDNYVEQRLETMWFEQQNKKLQEKRRDEETKNTMNQWSQARARMEAEIQRKKEHKNFATNFEKARGFVRTNWKSKNFNPSENPCELDSSTDDSQQEQTLNAEKKDHMSDEDSLFHKSKSLKKGEKLPTPEPLDELVDIASMSEMPSSRPTVEQQMETLQAIMDYNKKLPKRRKAKDSLSECQTSNIAATFTVKRDRKKKTMEMITHYNPVGITDGCRSTTFSQDKFSLFNKQVAIQRSASAIKIKTLRTQYDKLLMMDPPQPLLPGQPPIELAPSASVNQLADNPFTAENQFKEISLSVYNGPTAMVARKPRPLTTQDQLLRRIPGWKQPAVKAEIGPDGEPIVVPAAQSVYQRTPVLPAFTDLSEMITKDASDQYRQEQMLEAYSIKERLAHDGCQANMKVIKRALLLPDEPLRVPGTFVYPNPGVGLMKNPWPKKVKKKKGKKKKKK